MSSSMASSTNGLDASGNVVKNDGLTVESVQDIHISSSQTQPEDIERKARVDAIWQQMNKGVSRKTINSISSKPSSTVNRTSQKSSSQKTSTGWMTYLGLASKKTASVGQDVPEKKPSIAQNGTGDEAKKLAAAALSAIKDASALAATSGRGKVEITEVRDFAGEEIEFKKLVDANSKEASEKAKAASVGPPTAVDAFLEQIKKKQKLSVLDKTKKDWGEFKEENKGLEEELETYKKSSNQYLERVNFLQRTDYREFERERDARLAVQAKRKPDMREDP
ncbi:uncharacterized protein LOC132285199 [Cornus florida]|uniref:uncharacterized protein LOC132285199 n=1 Tax=Cornus florida TaxID=4283 RepID=UPI0028970FB5|nr:uncharacterized protein LOC132285199 [Cornus florida]